MIYYVYFFIDKHRKTTLGDVKRRVVYIRMLIFLRSVIKSKLNSKSLTIYYYTHTHTHDYRICC